MENDHKIGVFHTGDGTLWCFEVLDRRGALLGEGGGFETEEEAQKAGELFSGWYYS